MYKVRRPTSAEIAAELNHCSIPYRVLDGGSTDFMIIRTDYDSGDALLLCCLNTTMLSAFTHIADKIGGIYDIYVKLYYR